MKPLNFRLAKKSTITVKFDLIDSEGVSNARDQCPERFSGAQVDNSGCGAARIESY